MLTSDWPQCRAAEDLNIVPAESTCALMDPSRDLVHLQRQMIVLPGVLAFGLLGPLVRHLFQFGDVAS